MQLAGPTARERRIHAELAGGAAQLGVAEAATSLGEGAQLGAALRAGGFVALLERETGPGERAEAAIAGAREASLGLGRAAHRAGLAGATAGDADRVQARRAIDACRGLAVAGPQAAQVGVVAGRQPRPTAPGHRHGLSCSSGS